MSEFLKIFPVALMNYKLDYKISDPSVLLLISMFGYFWNAFIIYFTCYLVGKGLRHGLKDL